MRIRIYGPDRLVLNNLILVKILQVHVLVDKVLTGDDAPPGIKVRDQA